MGDVSIVGIGLDVCVPLCGVWVRFLGRNKQLEKCWRRTLCQLKCKKRWV